MIIVTGAAGFIGSALIGELLREGWQDIVAVDDFSRVEKLPNLEGKKLTARVERNVFFNWLDQNEKQVQFIFHLGARTDTTLFDKAIFDELNVRYSQRMWEACVKFGIPLVYASSAATYGDGALGYSDLEDPLPARLKPLNPYGESKNEFDIWALKQQQKPFFWAGLKFFNVYGPNEYHKGRMASVVLHAFNQISASGGMKLFRSHRADYRDGEQLRDFVYVKDLCQVCMFLMQHRKSSGLYNLGSGKARTFLDLVRATFKAMDRPENITFIDTPADIRDKYQYFTEARMEKLIGIGYDRPFTTLEEGVSDYVKNYLESGARC
ncbi:MAG: ADP-glyceromanno-heptose 6-epimerase [Flavobacteriales bacterium]|nr:ADP-glyceromanno-heptose 6-epimerase [Flavobacteriales bacterium]MBK6551203.1 ADP-glyceromanno-heptose 6-epimerase [Flavobacteriales bacterium]MBK6884775.1 ADP-glyceromanno-heptose 6-epimerase [Flavobacteriales bacterium]MBK7102095.1 ADP-glyceromanno-heptose 6-epimerase [Flavobacteriales bacterium]MBK7112565.1 ADP-glyceromanno-heptose 6-epimerase [Flavobacteriales bacterium]